MMQIHKIWQNRIIGLLFLHLLVFTVACDGSAPSGSTHNDPNNDEINFTVYKNAACGCCDEWANHLRASGFKVNFEITKDLNAIKEYYGIKPQYQSCHTAISGKTGYVFEGHIPAAIIREFIEARPAGAVGLTVPGMPIGSPGMEMGARRDPYDIFLLKVDGTMELFVHIGPDL